MNNQVRKLVQLSLFLALEIVISYFESWIPYPLPIPGFRLGLCNIFGLIALYFFSLKEYIGVTSLRVLVVGLLRGSLINFLISVGGTILSIGIVSVIYLFKKASIYGLSIASAIMHSLGQIIVVIIIYKLPQMINYFPIILISSIISSILIALLSSVLISRTKGIFFKGAMNNEKENI